MKKNKKKLLQAMKVKAAEERNMLFNPLRPDLKPTPLQQEILEDKETNQAWIMGGNQCLAKGTLIATPFGSKKVEDIKVGDLVFDEHGKPITVGRTFDNGPKDIWELTHKGKVTARVTENHKFFVRNSSKPKWEPRLVRVDELKRDHQVKVVDFVSRMGEVDVPTAYSLGALIGDGCSVQSPNYLYISSIDDKIPNKVAEDFKGNVTKNKGDNFTWKVGKVPDCDYYKNWVHLKYAHEKTTDYSILRTWNRKSLLKFVAGLIDTDGSVFYVKEQNQLVIAFGMQAKPVVEAVQSLMLDLWGLSPTLICDSRGKYVNGPVWEVKIQNNLDSVKVLKELDKYLLTESKKYKKEYDNLVCKRKTKGWQGVKAKNTRKQEHTYNITVLSETNLYLLANGYVTRNTGKSTIGGRVASWYFEESHPYCERREQWGTGPIKILVLGRVGQMIETELFENKIKPYLTPGSYDIKRANGLSHIIHKENGNMMIFASHHDLKAAREKIQGHKAHVVWLDEMVKDVSFLNELVMRLVTTNGRLYNTMTPLIESEEVFDFIDNAKEPHAKKFHLSQLDNPLFQEDPAMMAAVKANMANMSDHERETRIKGKFFRTTSTVFKMDRERDCMVPPGYRLRWRHVFAVDPASSSKTGYVALAEHPETGIWFVVRAGYVDPGKAPNDLLDALEAKIKGLNVVRRIYDTQASWFELTARSRGFKYIKVFNKVQRKADLIENVNIMFNKKKLKVDPILTELIKEVNGCKYSSTIDNKIVNSQKYHILDALQYAVDNLPKWVPEISNIPSLEQFEAELRQRSKKAREERLKKRRITNSRRRK